ncbi:hypothetical protein [Nocardia salmonicida]|uniref:hypothetical protein n=1 Tax=Nocardia salmonicida TaxID=53431 RepID=UPI0033D8EDFE
MISSLDEYPIHQTPQPMARVATSDRNFYDRSYFNACDRDGGTFLVAGLGVYPNLGVTDAFATVRRGDEQRVVRFSDALTQRSLDIRAGGFRIEVVEPLHKIRVVCEHEDLSFDLMWEGAFPVTQEHPHTLLTGLNKAMLDAQRFAQVGTWSGTLAVDGSDFTVDPAVWVGARDRSWGIRPVGDPDPAGRSAESPSEGFWWLYLPLAFDEFSVLVVIEEQPDGHRTVNDATRTWKDGRVEQLGWPRVHLTYKPGTRIPTAVRLELTTPDGKPLELEAEAGTFVALNVGCGYGGDPEWLHGQWKGHNWSESCRYDLTDPAIAARIPFGVIDHVGKARCGDAEGWGLFEHASLGRHDPTGFVNWGSVSP